MSISVRRGNTALCAHVGIPSLQITNEETDAEKGKRNLQILVDRHVLQYDLQIVVNLKHHIVEINMIHTQSIEITTCFPDVAYYFVSY